MDNVNDLPVEVLGQIFSLTAADDLTRSSRLRLGNYLCVPSGSFYHDGAPFVFLQVCRYWRSVAQATPLLWASLDASMRSHLQRTSTAAVALEHWLSLSHSIPLDFLLETQWSPEMPQGMLSTHAEAMLRVVASESHRWRSAAFDMDSRLAGVLIDFLINKSNAESFSQLTRLEIIIRPDHGDQVPIESLAPAIGTIESLRELYLDLFLPDGNIPSLLMPIPWHQLTSIYLGMTMTMDQVAFFLSQSISALSATFTTVDGSTVWRPDKERCTLPKLKSLTMDGSPSLWALLDQFDLPALENLSMTSTSIADCNALERLIEQSKPCIRQISLRVDGPGAVPESDLAKFLRIPMIRHVSHVEFDGWDILEIARAVMAQLKDDIPALWSWRPWLDGERVGWKPQFDVVDKCITRIIPAPQIL